MSKDFVRTKRAFQFTGELKTISGDVVNLNAEIVWSWLKKKFNSKDYPANIPKNISKNYFRKTLPDTNVETFYIASEVFCCQIEEAKERKWTTEIEIALRTGKVLFGVKVSYTAPEGSDIERDKFSVPRFVKVVVEKNSLSDVRELNKILRADSQEGLEELYDLITDERRIFPVVVFTDSKDELGNFKPIIEPELLLPHVGLIAHVVHISGDWSRQWKDMVEDGWDVYNGAVRTYYKDVTFDYADLYRHPLSTTQRIENCKYVNSDGEEQFGKSAFLALLIEKLKNNDRRIFIDWKGRGHKFLYVVRHESELAERAALVERTRSLADSEYEEEFNRCAEEIDNLQKAKDSLELDLLEADENLKMKDSIIFSLEQRIENLQQQLAAAGKTEQIIPDKCTYENIPKWIATYFPTTLYLTSRAKRSLKKAEFEDTELVYKWLQFLGTEYWQMRMGMLDRKTVEVTAKKLGIKQLNEPAISEARRGEQDDEYYMYYNGEKCTIDFHIKTGISSEPRYCLRIYYSWDDEKNITVLGDLPGHLETRKT